MEGVDHDLTVRIEDACGTVVEASATVQLDFPPRDPGSPRPTTVPRPEAW